jgi:hypothetical protein
MPPLSIAEGSTLACMIYYSAPRQPFFFDIYYDFFLAPRSPQSMSDNAIKVSDLSQAMRVI